MDVVKLSPGDPIHATATTKPSGLQANLSTDQYILCPSSGQAPVEPCEDISSQISSYLKPKHSGCRTAITWRTWMLLATARKREVPYCSVVGVTLAGEGQEEGGGNNNVMAPVLLPHRRPHGLTKEPPQRMHHGFVQMRRPTHALHVRHITHMRYQI